MVGAPARRQQVAYAQKRGLSQRKACALLSTSRSSVHYQSRLQERDEPLIKAMTELAADDGTHYRAFVCTRPNPWGYPAGDRSCKLDQIEPPHLGRLMDKIKNGEKRNPAEYFYTIGEESNE